MSKEPPLKVLLCGLDGSGKTTFTWACQKRDLTKSSPSPTRGYDSIQITISYIPSVDTLTEMNSESIGALTVDPFFGPGVSSEESSKKGKRTRTASDLAAVFKKKRRECTIYDVGGGKYSRSFGSPLYPSVGAVIMVVDLTETKRIALGECEERVIEIVENTGPQVPIALVLNSKGQELEDCPMRAFNVTKVLNLDKYVKPKDDSVELLDEERAQEKDGHLSMPPADEELEITLDTRDHRLFSRDTAPSASSMMSDEKTDELISGIQATAMPLLSSLTISPPPDSTSAASIAALTDSAAVSPKLPPVSGPVDSSSDSDDSEYNDDLNPSELAVKDPTVTAAAASAASSSSSDTRSSIKGSDIGDTAEDDEGDSPPPMLARRKSVNLESGKVGGDGRWWKIFEIDTADYPSVKLVLQWLLQAKAEQHKVNVESAGSTAGEFGMSSPPISEDAEQEPISSTTVPRRQSLTEILKSVGSVGKRSSVTSMVIDTDRFGPNALRKTCSEHGCKKDAFHSTPMGDYCRSCGKWWCNGHLSRMAPAQSGGRKCISGCKGRKKATDWEAMKDRFEESKKGS